VISTSNGVNLDSVKTHFQKSRARPYKGSYLGRQFVCLGHGDTSRDISRRVSFSDTDWKLSEFVIEHWQIVAKLLPTASAELIEN